MNTSDDNPESPPPASPKRKRRRRRRRQQRRRQRKASPPQEDGKESKDYLRAKLDPLQKIITKRRHIRPESLIPPGVEPGQEELQQAEVAVQEKIRAFSDVEQDKLTGSGLYWSQENWENFCSTTSMGGWYLLVYGSGTKGICAALWRTLWSLFMAVSIITALVLVAFASVSYQNDSVLTTFDSERGRRWNQVRFPSIVICNQNQGRRSFLREFGYFSDDPNDPLWKAMVETVFAGVPENADEDDKNALNKSRRIKELGHQISDMYLSRSKYSEVASLPLPPIESLNNDIDYFRMAATQKAGQSMILSAKYKGIWKPLDELVIMHPFFRTDFGFCSYIRPEAMFNKKLENESFHKLLAFNEKEFGSGIKLGNNRGLEILLDAETFDWGWSPSDGQGFVVAVQHNLDFPHMQFDVLDLKPGFNTKLAVKATVTRTDKAVQDRFRPEGRNCLFDSEYLPFKKLPQNRFRYGLHNCIIDEGFDQLGQNCNCTGAVGSVDNLSGKPCYGKGLTCFNNIFKHFSRIQHGIDLFNNRVCMNACNEERYEAKISHLRFPNRNLLVKNTTLFCTIYRKMKAICNDTLRELSLYETFFEMCQTLAENSDGICVHPEVMVPEEFFYEEGVIRRLGDAINKTIGEGKYQFEVKDGFRIGKNRTLHNAVFQYARNNLAVLNVVFQDLELKSILRSERQPPIWFVANIGGIISLSTGCSFITFFEFIYFAFSYCLYVRRRLANRRIEILQIKKDRAELNEWRMKQSRISQEVK